MITTSGGGPTGVTITRLAGTFGGVTTTTGEAPSVTTTSPLSTEPVTMTVGGSVTSRTSSLMARARRRS
jgi:hypothetical protein